mmetsp:Transcript_46057/g.80556  ORF Transcript_46057/g.80556 Transcript_46057/m.80556 type:complete len:198 (-) Transcript_46057:114-707(-)
MSGHGNLFLVLGVTETCTNDEVKAAYFKLAKQWHPDVNSDPMATAKFRAISDAYETLKTDKSRSDYIVRLYQQNTGTGQSSTWSYTDSANNHQHSYGDKWNATRNYSEESVRYRRQRYGPMFKYVLVPGILVLSTLYFANKFSKQGPPPKVQTVEAWYNMRTKRWETPAPWNADYKKSIKEQPTQQVEKSRVHNSSR